MRQTILFIGLILAAGPAFIAGSADVPLVQVREAGGIYTVAARFTVTEMPADVLAVLADYEQIPRFMPGVRTSIVLERSNGRAVVEQEAVSTMMGFSKRMHLILEVQEEPGALLFHDRCGRSFRSYDGAWRVAREGDVTAIEYELSAQPSFDVPRFILKRLLRRDSGDMIVQLRREVTRRVTPR